MAVSSFIEAFSLISILFLGLAAEASKAFVIESKSWQYKGHHIGYEEAKRAQVVTPDENDVATTTTTSTVAATSMKRSNDNHPILVLNGFGVGSFHQHRLMPNLISVSEGEDGKDEVVRTVFGVDYLGQGRSWPIDCDDGNSMNEQGLTYSIDMWADQIIEFIESVIIPNHGSETKVHLIGNSVGGHLSAILAAKRPDLIESICLLNATPVWGLNLPGWNGMLPPPFVPRKIGRFLFDQIRDLNTIEKYLNAAYANPDAFDSELVGQIRACTEGKGGHAAFASILWSPPTVSLNLFQPTPVIIISLNEEFHLPTSFFFTCINIFSSKQKKGHDKNFYSILTQLKCDVLLIFGKNDPWCTPAFAKRMYQSLQERHENSNDSHDNKHAPVHRYVELDNCGHCPNHEAATLVGMIASRWTSTNQRHKDSLCLLSNLDKESSDVLFVKEPWGIVSGREV